MGVFTPAAFKTLQSDLERVVRVESLISPRGKDELLKLLGKAEKNVIVVESFLSRAIFEDGRVIRSLERLVSRGCSIQISFRKSENEIWPTGVDIVGLLRTENPKLVNLKLKHDKIKLFVNKTVIQKHFYIVDGKHVCVEFSHGRDPFGPATFFYDDEEYARVWDEIFEEGKRDRIEIKRKMLEGGLRRRQVYKR